MGQSPKSERSKSLKNQLSILEHPFDDNLYSMIKKEIKMDQRKVSNTYDSQKILSESSPSFFSTLKVSTIFYSLCVLVTIGLGGLAARHFLSKFQTKPEYLFAYFEVKVIDGDGHPLVGVDVKRLGKKIGVTDSFGEWRRYLKVPLGGVIALEFTKMHRGTLLSATRNFAIPIEKKSSKDIELHGSVQLATPREEPPPPPQAAPPQTQPFSLAFQTPEALLGGVVTILEKMTQAAGIPLSPNPSAQVLVSLLPDPTASVGNSLLLIKIAAEGKAEKSFLRNYTGEAQAVAQSIFSVLKMKLSDEEERFPPQPNWQKLKLKVLGQELAGVKIYVSGFEAKKLAAEDNLFEYWGLPAERANVTVLDQKKIVRRVQIMNSKDHPPFVSLPGAPVVKNEAKH